MTRHRSLLAGLACLTGLTGLLPPPAHAGSYLVHSCHADGINAVWTPSHTPNTTAYVQCPGGVNGNQGMVVRNVYASSPAAALSNARLKATAAPGTYFDRITFNGQIYSNFSWHSGLLHPVQGWIWCGPTCSTVPFWTTFAVDHFMSPSLEFMTICGGTKCNRNGLQGAVMLKDVSIRVQDPTRPNVSIVGGSVASGGWKRGTQTIDVAGSDNAGVRLLRVRVDGHSRVETGITCDFHVVSPCPAQARELLRFETDRFSDGRHDLSAEVHDAGGNVAAFDSSILVDNTPPAPVRALVPTKQGWRADNSFGVSWTNPPAGVGGPIAGAMYELCTAIGPKSCEPVRRVSGTGVTSIEGIRLPTPGQWSLRVWLIDAAGNENSQTFREASLRWDPSPPSVKLLPRTEDDPTRIRVLATDQPSGIASAEVEVRRSGESVWHSLPAVLDEQGFTATIDDEALPAGVYAVRVRARDHAGNERSVDGANVQLPIRLTTTLAVGKPGRRRAGPAGDRHGHRVLIRKPRTRYGQAMKLSGRLVSPGGNPLPDREVEVTQRLRLPGQDWTRVANVRTNTRGRFLFRAPPGPSRLLRFRFAGSATIRGQSSIVDLRVRAASSIRVNDRRVVNGEAVTFRGTVRGEPIPPVGKLLQLQVRARGAWLTFATPRADARGNWAHDYRFTATRGVTRYRFRVRLPREAGYPYEAGTSRAVAVKVTGL